MWPRDIVRAGAAVLELEERPVVLQLSTYSANNGNSQDDVISTIEPIFTAVGLQLVAKVQADGNMMSMVFANRARSIRDSRLGQRFTMWFSQATAPA
jgi:hypothetical protein